MPEDEPFATDPTDSVDGAVLTRNIVAFGRFLRRLGLAVDPGQTRLFLEGLERVGISSRRDVKAVGRTVFVRRREEVPLYDAAFDLFWRRSMTGAGASGRLPRIRQQAWRESGTPIGADSTGSPRGDTVDVVSPRSASDLEVLRTADFADMTADESRDAESMISALRPRLPLRPSRRRTVARRGERLAMRQLMRRSSSTGGEPLIWRWLRRRVRPRPIVLVADISGSMERYSRFLMKFGHTLARLGAPVEVFVFGTRLTRVTRELRVRNPDAALRLVGRTVVDWDGGTRIGESLRALNRRWVRRTIRSGAIVIIASDGWERGDPALLAREMEILHRSCHRLIWLDPLASREGFEPTALGLQAALPHVDAFLPCASIASLEELAAKLVSPTLGNQSFSRPRSGRKYA